MSLSYKVMLACLFGSLMILSTVALSVSIRRRFELLPVCDRRRQASSEIFMKIRAPGRTQTAAKMACARRWPGDAEKPQGQVPLPSVDRENRHRRGSLRPSPLLPRQSPTDF